MIDRLAETPDYGCVFGDAVVTLSPGAQAIRQRFERRLKALLALPQMADAWRNHVSKWSGIFGRLLLTFHMIEHGPRLKALKKATKGRVNREGVAWA
jgi:hypothetical protein